MFSIIILIENIKDSFIIKEARHRRPAPPHIILDEKNLLGFLPCKVVDTTKVLASIYAGN
jgi:hypothetical protein